MGGYTGEFLRDELLGETDGEASVVPHLLTLLVAGGGVEVVALDGVLSLLLGGADGVPGVGLVHDIIHHGDVATRWRGEGKHTSRLWRARRACPGRRRGRRRRTWRRSRRWA